MSEYIFKMPDVGEGVTEAEITAWHVKLGDDVTEDAPIADAMTDKATVELTAPVSGTVKSLGCAEGEILAIGAALIVFETDADAAQDSGQKNETEAAKTEAAPAPTPTPAPKETPPDAPENPAPQSLQGARPLAAPAVRRAAKDKGIDLASVTPTGRKGNVTHRDLFNHQQAAKSGGRQKNTSKTEIKVKGMRRAIATAMSASKRNIPHFSYVEAIDMTEIEALRAHLNANRNDSQPKLTLLPFFMCAIVKAAAKWPQCNATYDDEAGVITQYGGVHIGMAAQTKEGLMVPVVHHAEALSLWEMAETAARLAASAKEGSIKPDMLKGGTITLTSLGPLGGVVTTPVINRPQTAIIGPNKIVETPTIIGGQVCVRKMMNLSSSFDHRVVDGYDAAAMIQYIKGLLEHPGALFIAD